MHPEADGKSIRRSFDKASGQSAIHRVSAWSASNRMVLGQLTCDQKSNEIMALPKLPAMLSSVRGHWTIENSLRWSLDVTFREDDCPLRQGHGAENFSPLRRWPLNLLEADPAPRAGIKAKRLKCGWDHDDLLQILMASR